MNTLIKSQTPLIMPRVDKAGTRTPVEGVPAKYSVIGNVLKAGDNQKYVVTADGLEKVSNFMAKLLLEGPNATAVNKGGDKMEAISVSTDSITPKRDDKDQVVQFMSEVPGTALWPSEAVTMANAAATRRSPGIGDSGKGADVACSVYHGTSTEYANGASKALGFDGAYRR